MKTFRRLIFGEVINAVAFVTFGFLALLFFFDFVDEIQRIGGNQGVYQLRHALVFVASMIPSHLYELLPITVLIGTIFVMARFAQSSEFTILRTSGLAPSMALKNLLGLGFVFVLLTFAVGDYLSPVSDQFGQMLKSKYLKEITVGKTGAWLREKQDDRSYAVNVATLTPEGQPSVIRIFEFNKDGQWIALTKAKSGLVTTENTWKLQGVERNELVRQGTEASLSRKYKDSETWPTGITAEMISVALLKPERMATIDLFQYIRHLSANGQTTQRFEIEFWKKVFYPMSCLVMMVLALPFAYLHFRSGNIATHVFMGVLAGISFFLLNNVFGYIGNINNWEPWFAAAAPGMLYSLASLAAFGWLVLRQ